MTKKVILEEPSLPPPHLPWWGSDPGRVLCMLGKLATIESYISASEMYLVKDLQVCIGMHLSAVYSFISYCYTFYVRSS